MAKSARTRLSEKKEAKKVMLDKDFAGVKRGQMLFIATPQIVADYIGRIPYGETRTIEYMRRDMARRRGCDATCPVSTAIFIRIAAEAALEDLDSGKDVSQIIPFWRLLQSKDKIAKRLTVDGEWIDLQRDLESASNG